VDPSHPAPVTLWEEGGPSARSMELLGEEPLSIRVDGKPYAVVMRTPGDEVAHAAGFSLGEGIIDSAADCSAIALCEGETANVVTVTLTPARRTAVAGVLERRNYISQTSCGICGKELVEDLFQEVRPVRPADPVDLRSLRAGMEAMAASQPLRAKTRASHAAALCDRHGAPIALAEDIGRHNALDKAIGQALLRGTLGQAALVVLTSRVSYEMVQKTARAGVPVMFSVSRPPRLAVDVAARLDMAVACLAPGNGVYVFCGQNRFRFPQPT
jgi:FdhD protein